MMSITPGDLPERVRAIRKERRMTQEQFAEAAGVRYRAYQNFENGVNRPQPANLRKILAYAGIDAGDEQADREPVDGEVSYFLSVVQMWLTNMDPERRTYVIHELTRRIVSGNLAPMPPMQHVHDTHD